MFNLPFNWENPRILVSNDDGIDAPGIAVLEKIARTLSHDVWVVAPQTEQSCTSHSVTLKRPLRIIERGEKRFTVDGTPSDCVLLAINNIMKDHRPDLVLSGVNYGLNTGLSVTYSGTIAVAMESTLLGVPAIAFSAQVGRDSSAPNWDTVQHFAPNIIRQIMAMAWPRQVLMSVNFPNVPAADILDIECCHHVDEKMGDDIITRKDQWGDDYYWVSHFQRSDDLARGSDESAIRNKAITITPLHLDLTHYDMLARMKTHFAAHQPIKGVA